MKKRYLLYMSSAIILLGVITSVFMYINNIKQQAFSTSVINSLGGEKVLKDKCVKQHAGDIVMADGKKYERLLSLEDITRITKMCDCVVVKSHSTIQENKDKWREITSRNLPAEAIDTLHSLFMVNYTICELELQHWLNKKYKTID